MKLRIAVLLFLMWLVAGCSSASPSAKRVPPTPLPTKTPLPAFVPPMPTATPVPGQAILKVGDKLTLKRDDGAIFVIHTWQLSDGWGNPTPQPSSTREYWDSFDWFNLVDTNLLPPDQAAELKTTFSTSPDLASQDGLGRLHANGEVWPNARQTTGLEDSGIRLIGRHVGVVVEFDSRWSVDRMEHGIRYGR